MMNTLLDFINKDLQVFERIQTNGYLVHIILSRDVKCQTKRILPPVVGEDYRLVVVVVGLVASLQQLLRFVARPKPEEDPEVLLVLVLL